MTALSGQNKIEYVSLIFPQKKLLEELDIDALPEQAQQKLPHLKNVRFYYLSPFGMAPQLEPAPKITTCGLFFILNSYASYSFPIYSTPITVCY